MVQRVEDVYTWFVLYTDDSSLGEHDREEGLGFAEVEEARVKTLLLLPRHKEGPSYGVDIPKGAHPVFFRRRSMELNPLSDQTDNHFTAHCIGWKCDEQAVYLFILDDGSTLLTDNLQAI